MLIFFWRWKTVRKINVLTQNMRNNLLLIFFCQIKVSNSRKVIVWLSSSYQLVLTGWRKNRTNHCVAKRFSNTSFKKVCFTIERRRRKKFFFSITKRPRSHCWKIINSCTCLLFCFFIFYFFNLFSILLKDVLTIWSWSNFRFLIFASWKKKKKRIRLF